MNTVEKSTAAVCLIGRTNVGKSTLFNTLLEKKLSITSPRSGTTRDRNYQPMNWRGISFFLIDTGGLDIKGQAQLENNVIRQAQIAIKESDVIIFLIDGLVGVTKEDRQVAHYLKKINKPILLAVNKIDSPQKRRMVVLAEFLRLGLKNPLLVSAKTGSGTGDLLDEIVESISTKQKSETPLASGLKMAVLGKPNVGKSSLVNAVLGEERVIVHSQPHTTRDAQNISFNFRGKQLTIIDTAGIRTIRKIQETVEKESVNKSLIILKQTDVVLLVLDISQTISHQDAHLAMLIQAAKKPCMIIANKWDLVPDRDEEYQKRYVRYINSHLPHLGWAPIVFVSAIDNHNIDKCLDMALFCYAEYNKKIDDATLEQFMKKVKTEHLPSRRKKESFPKIYSLRQIKAAPPTFTLKIQKRESLHPSYLNFLENRLRQWFGFRGSPLFITLKSFKFK